VLAADASAARKRREQAERQARVERWAEQAGTAALAGRDLPPAGTLAADQHLTGLAQGLRAAGVAGTMDQLRAQVFIALLTGQPVTSLLPPGTASSPETSDSGIPGASGGGGAPGGPGASGGGRAPGGPGASGGGGAPGGPRWPGLAGLVNLTMPLGTWLGFMDLPGEVPGFGPLAPGDSRSLGQAMAEDPRTRWCLTLTGEGGRPVAHGCVPRRRGPPPTDAGPPATGAEPPPPDDGPPATDAGPPPTDAGPPPTSSSNPRSSAGDTSNTRSSAGNTSNTGPPAAVGPCPRVRTGTGVAAGSGSKPPDDRPRSRSQTRGDAPRSTRVGPALAGAVAAWVAGVPVAWLEAGECAHRRQSAGYRPALGLQHLVRVRQQLCVFPGCGRAARRCDVDHTVPYHCGGRTCECNLAPLCRKHHQAKQAQGWRLDQPEPGIMIWTTPSGRRYTTFPSV
jgi:hypothetical protein